ncbi:hypothetical protein GOBAR_DD10162 [Gossypium barbadense]|nr:hypothetical protein GOBAR_DD10162 [Gossypium barbadense]
MKSTSVETVGDGYGVVFGSWVVVEKKTRQNSRDFKNQKPDFSGKEGSRSKFDALSRSQISEAWRVRRLRPLSPTGNVREVLDKLALKVTGRFLSLVGIIQLGPSP